MLASGIYYYCWNIYWDSIKGQKHRIPGLRRTITLLMVDFLSNLSCFSGCLMFAIEWPLYLKMEPGESGTLMVSMVLTQISTAELVNMSQIISKSGMCTCMYSEAMLI